MTPADPRGNVPPPALTETPPPLGGTKPVPAAIYRVPPLPDPAVIIVTHHPDGTVTAACRGVTGTGRSEDEALLALGNELLDPAGGGD